jgi:hypothetical protein
VEPNENPNLWESVKFVGGQGETALFQTHFNHVLLHIPTELAEGLSKLKEGDIVFIQRESVGSQGWLRAVRSYTEVNAKLKSAGKHEAEFILSGNSSTLIAWVNNQGIIHRLQQLAAGTEVILELMDYDEENGHGELYNLRTPNQVNQ